MGTRLLDPLAKLLDNVGAPISGGTLEFYEKGTSTPKAVFSDAVLATSLGSTVTTNSSGYPASSGTTVGVWGNGDYKMIVKDASGVTIRTEDPLVGVETSGVIQIDTVADMTGLSKVSLSATAVYRAAGRITKGDGGGGDFYWSSASTATADTGTIFASDEGGTGRFLRIYDGALNAKWFGAVGDGTNNDTAELQAAINACSSTVATYSTSNELYVPKGVYLVSSTLTLVDGIKMYGDGYLATSIRTVSAIVLIDYTPASYTEAGIAVEHLSLVGSSSLSDDLVQLGNGTFAMFYGVRFRETAGSCIKIVDEFLMTRCQFCIFESFAGYGVEVAALATLFSAEHIQVNANAIVGTAFFGSLTTGLGQLTLDHVNVNGNSNIGSLLYVGNGNVSQAVISSCYAEFLTAPAILAAASASGVIGEMVVERCNLLGGDSVHIDLDNGNSHRNISIRHNRSPMTTGAFFGPGSTTSYEVYGNSIDGGAHVSGFGTADRVTKFTGGTAHAQVAGTFTGTLTGCTTSPSDTVRYTAADGIVTLYIPSISATSNSTSATITGMTPDHIKPARAQIVPCRYTDNGTDALGLASIATNGTITLTDQAGSTTAFTASGTKGVAACTIQYSLE